MAVAAAAVKGGVPPPGPAALDAETPRKQRYQEAGSPARAVGAAPAAAAAAAAAIAAAGNGAPLRAHIGRSWVIAGYGPHLDGLDLSWFSPCGPAARGPAADGPADHDGAAAAAAAAAGAAASAASLPLRRALVDSFGVIVGGGDLDGLMLDDFAPLAPIAPPAPPAPPAPLPRADPGSLFDACWRGDLTDVLSRLARGAAADAPGTDAWTPLIAACANGHVEVACALLARGAQQAPATRHARRTALHYAVLRGHARVVALLCACGGADARAALAARDYSGRTPRELAAARGARACEAALRARVEPLPVGEAELRHREAELLATLGR